MHTEKFTKSLSTVEKLYKKKQKSLQHKKYTKKNPQIKNTQYNFSTHKKKKNTAKDNVDFIFV